MDGNISDSLIVTLILHPRFGYILQPVFALFQPEIEVYTITEMAVSSSSAFPLLDEDKQKIVRCAERYADKNLMVSYSSEKSEAAFLQKVAEKDIDLYIRPFIEKRHREIVGLMLKTDTPLFIRTKIQIRDFRVNQAVELMKDPSRMLFIFRNRETFTYTAKVQNGKTEITLDGRFFAPLVADPAITVIGNQLHHFNDIDAKKLTPFFTKAQIEVPPGSVDAYIRKFVVQCVRNYETIGEGLTIFEQQHDPVAVLTLEKGMDLLPVLHLRFRYGDNSFSINKPYKKEVELHEHGGDFSIGWYYRDRNWEEKHIGLLTDAGLYKTQFGQFVTEEMIHPHASLEEEGQDGSSGTGSDGTGVVEWLNRNGALLKQFELTQSFGKLLYFTGEIGLQMKVDDTGDWFDMHCTACFDDVRIPFVQLKDHILNGVREYVLPDGRIAVLPQEWFVRFGEMCRYGVVSGDDIRLPRYYFRVKELAENGRFLDKNGGWQPQGDIEIPKTLNATLRHYQEIGFRWLVYLHENGFGGFLADDMGLGKTLQAIALLLHIYGEMPVVAKKIDRTPRQLSLFDDPVSLKDEEKAGDVKGTGCPGEIGDLGDRGDAVGRGDLKEREYVIDRYDSAVGRKLLLPSLIVMPTSLIHNWVNELEKFAPSLKVYVHTGGNRLQGSQFAKSISDYHIVLTTYGTVRQDIHFLSDYPFHYLILDESQYIKNPSSQIFSAVKQLSSTYKLALTGTPVENSLSDLWAQMDFLNAHMLGKQGEFRMRFREANVMKEEREQQQLLKIIDPFILRRTKEEVAPELPPLTDEIIYCEMEDDQALLYNMEKNRVRNMLMEQYHDDHRLYNAVALSSLMRLRLLANHPKISMPDYAGTSTKLEQIMEQADVLFSGGHKILIFSSFVKHLEIIASQFDDRGWRYAWLTGRTVNREAEIDRFHSDENVKAFFISLKAGGTGLNLTAADYVFMIDPWWNPAAEMQAVSRAHRIGQEKKVTLYRFITKDTVEEKIQRLQRYKKALTDAVIRSQFSIEEMKELLE